MMLCLLRSARYVSIPGISHSQHSQAECRLGNDLEEIGPTAHQICEDVTEDDVLPNHGLHPTQAIAAHDEPDFERTETPSQGELPIPIVDHSAQFRIGVPQVAWGYI